MTVGRMRDRLGLDRGIHCHPLACRLCRRLGAHGDAERLGQQQLELLGPDPAPPAGHRRAVEHQLVAEELLAAEELEVRVLHPRSEEHTSELQSLMRISYAVFCLKKKKNTNKQ